jgi:two-component system C4-dicarboxylate transport sensor histidine kinase DctB
LGTTSGVRGYYFASAVRNRAGEVAGAIAVKVDLEAIEADWRRQAEAIIVTDSEGIVFLSTESAWLYQGFLPLTPDRVARTAAVRRYANVVVAPLAHDWTDIQGLAVLQLVTPNGRREYLEARALMPLADWTVRVLLDTAGARAQARLASAAFLLGLGIVGGLVGVWLQRRYRLAGRIAAQEHAKAELERRVAERTADLARVNARMQGEVAERRATEAELRRTQADLVQAGKLAALGQMSAALSHEINQPLAAARNYADSAAILIDRGDTQRARENVGQIVALIDRMAAIAQHLRNVARKPDAPLKVVDLGRAVAEALALAAPRLARVAVSVDLAEGLPAVQSGPVRLQQVLGNVLSNAADALEERVFPRIEIAGRLEGAFVLLDIRDHGPGVAGAIADRIFDPFFTTKRVGSGLGLGLSISYNIMKDFGGDLRVANHPGGGAVFTLVLNVADARRVAAE